jgi:uncharacterized protein YecE (DUF72 family)
MGEVEAPSGARRGVTRVGTSGWSYPDWKSIVYPPNPPAGGRELRYISEFLDSVEINNTFYRPPRPAYCEKWLREVEHNPGFIFTLKLWQRFTHEHEEPWQPEDIETFRTGIAPLAESRRLGAVLIQYAWSFRRTAANTDNLLRVAEGFSDYPLVVELRHASWNVEEFQETLRKHKIGFCNIDQPFTRSSICDTNIATGPVAYYRFHGRNREKWFDKEAGKDERYNYLYSEAELSPWVGKIKRMAEQVEEIYVMANNHYRGQAFANALQMKSWLSGSKVAVPPMLLKQYSFLKEIARQE